jgi:ABC-type glycerol-3-phosphate transport system substrate-binding protein
LVWSAQEFDKRQSKRNRDHEVYETIRRYHRRSGMLRWLGSRSAAQSSFHAKAKEEGRVLIYTSLAASDNKPFQAAFEQAYPGIKLEIYRASGTTILQKILTESRAGAHLADAVLTEGTVLHALKDNKLLVKFDSPERKAFDDRFKDKEGILDRCLSHRAFDSL